VAQIVAMYLSRLIGWWTQESAHRACHAGTLAAGVGLLFCF